MSKVGSGERRDNERAGRAGPHGLWKETDFYSEGDVKVLKGSELMMRYDLHLKE